ncbi:MAG: tRNA1(Val) (adenine(37)-N6)-methyltransferase [Candidatus Izemoplasmatales bacterium]
MDEYLHDLLAYDGLKIYQTENDFRFSLDSLLLGDFVEIKLRTKKIIELGCGTGAVLLYLSLKTKAELIGVDIQNDSLNLAKKSIDYNDLDQQISLINHDVKKLTEIFKPSQFDIVVSNPPFFKFDDSSFINQKSSLSLSRHEIDLTFNDVVEATKKILKTNGRFTFIHRADRLEDIIASLSKNDFAVKRMKFVFTKQNKPAMMVLIEASNNGKSGGLKVLPPLYVYDENGDYTEKIKSIFYLGADE